MTRVLQVGLGLSILCVIAGVVGMLAGVGQPTEPHALRFDPDPFVIPFAMAKHAESDFAVDVVNDSALPSRILGVEEFCSSACFLGRELPVTVPPWGRSRIVIHVKANVAGRISEAVDFWTDRPDQPRLTMRVEGNIQEDLLDDAISSIER